MSHPSPRRTRSGGHGWTLGFVSVFVLLYAAAVFLPPLGVGQAGADSGGRQERPESPAYHGPLELTSTGRGSLTLGEEFPPPDNPDFTFQFAESVSVPHEDNGEGSHLSHPYSITINAGELKGIADVRLPCDVSESGYSATCSGPDVGDLVKKNKTWGFSIAANEDTEIGETATIVVTTNAENHAFTRGPPPAWWEINVGPQFVTAPISGTGKGEPGTPYRTSLAFENNGPGTAEGAILRYSGSVGILFAEKYSNCSYGEEIDKSIIGGGKRRVALCAFQGSFKPGTMYRLTDPVRFRVADYAKHESFSARFLPAEHKSVKKQHDSDYRQGDGRRLSLQPVSEEVSYAHGTEINLASDSKYDLDISGDRVSGDRGDTVTADVTYQNHGPARVKWEPNEGAWWWSFTVEVPEGATVTEAPEECHPIVETGARIHKPIEKARHFKCRVQTPIRAETTLHFPFELRIDKVVKNATGALEFSNSEADNDGDPRNNSGTITINGTGEEKAPGGG